jgi:hypothetical protein
MSTNAIERQITVITDPESVQKLIDIITSDEPIKPINKELYSLEERIRAEKLLSDFLKRLKLK